ncbi:MAG: sulfurtransferase [Acidimicrobiia bacterium]
MSPLVGVAELAARIHDPLLRVCDVRWYLADPALGRREYGEGHLPGAVFVDLEEVLTGDEGPGRHPLPRPGEFARAIGALGIGPHHRVVAYDASGGSTAARLWWMLRAIGHPEVAVLDGGLPAWVEAGHAVSTEVPGHPPEDVPAPERWPGVVDRHLVAASLGRIVLLDARAGERYRGEIEPVDPVAGHIPTARNVPYATLLDGHRLLPVGELRNRLALAGVSPERPTVASCGSGVTACHLLLAMEVAGMGSGLLYEGSWSDWSAHLALPVATGTDPGAVTDA